MKELLDYPLTWTALLVAGPVLVCVVGAHWDTLATAASRVLTAVGIALAIVDHLLFGSSPRESTRAAEGVDPWSLQTPEERLLWLVDDVEHPRFQRGA